MVGEQPIPSATESAVANAQAWFAAHHRGSLPTQLVDFWGTTNGISLNGTSLWAAEETNDISGVVETNVLYVDEFPELFCLGNADDVWMYAYRPAAGTYEIVATHGFDQVDRTFDSFDELATHILGQAITSVNL